MKYAILVMCLFLLGFAAPPVTPLILTTKSSGKVFEVVKNDKMVIDLEHTPGTGYIWRLNKIDSSILTFQVYYLNTNKVLGGKVKVKYVFCAKKSGVVKLNFTLTKPGIILVVVKEIDFTIKVK